MWDFWDRKTKIALLVARVVLERKLCDLVHENENDYPTGQV